MRFRKISDFDRNYHFTLFQKIRIFSGFTAFEKKADMWLDFVFLKNMYEILQLLYVLYEECN